MTEEVKLEQNTESPAPEQKEPSDIEKRAMEMGWRPREEFNGSDDDFIDAKEFVRRQPLFEKIESTTKQVKQLRSAIDLLKNHFSEREKVAVANAIERLREAREEAITNADGKTVTAIENEIKRAEKQVEKIDKLNEQIAAEPTVHPSFVAWTNRNPWYTSNRAMRVFADEVGIELNNQGLAPDEVLKKVEEAVKKEFSHKFRNPNKDTAPDVESGSNGNTKSKKEDFPLDEYQRKTLNLFVSTGVMTKDEYIDSLKKLGKK